MAHNINFTNGKASFMSLRESAWHGLGQIIQEPVGSKEAIKLAGLDWNVEEMPLIRGDATPVTSHKSIVRGDTKETLGIVGTNWTPIQNHALFDWLDGLDGFAEVILETAGALGKGETVWVLARCKGLEFGIKGDEHTGYMCLSNGHAGNAMLTVTPTMIRVCCQNTMRMMHVAADRKDTLETGWTLRHTPSIQDNFDRIRDCYARTTKSWKRTQEVLNFLASKPLTDDALTRLTTEPFATVKAPSVIQGINDAEASQGFGDEKERANAAAGILAEARIASIHKILASPTCQTGTKDTLYSGLQAVTEYIEYESPVRTNTKGLDEKAKARQIAMQRFEAANFGGLGDTRKSKAFTLAMELAGA